MKVLGILSLLLYAASLGRQEVPETVLEHEESYTGKTCEGDHAFRDGVFNQAEWENENIHEKNYAEQINDNNDDIFVNNKIGSSGASFDEADRGPHSENDMQGEHQDKGIFSSDQHHVVGGECDSVCENSATEPPLAVDDTGGDTPPAEPPAGLGETERGETPPTESQEPEAPFPTLEVIGIDQTSQDKSNNVTPQKETTNTQQEQPVSRQRYVPLLYTIRTLFNTLLSEFSEESSSQDTPFNSSELATGNLTVAEELIKDSNGTANGTEPSKKTRFQCAVKNITANATGEVKIVNSTELLQILNFSKSQKVSPCVLVMFYSPWCHFCARAAPHYNALAKAFPQLDVLAVDTSHFSYLNTRFGTVAVPSVMLFHARSAVRFNHTARVLDNFIQFVTNNTGIEADKSVKLEPAHFLGPLPSVVVQGRDWLLWLSWIFVIICSIYGFERSHYGQSFITRLRVLWQEHQHIE